ncbi:MAG TPA: MFS transporter [Mycobacteriales bacterium]|jgi:MFS family permease|nr:MFS transporter [Mycobacteriales bacterium]
MEDNDAVTRSRMRLALLLNSIGDGGYYVSAVVVFHQLLGMSVGQIGLALTLAWTAGFGMTAPLGRVADRWGLRPTAVALCLATAGATLAVLWARDFAAFVGILVAYGVAQSGLHAVRQAMVATLVPGPERTRFRARLQTVGNAGIGAGALVGGIALAVATPAAYAAVLVLDAAGFVAAAVVTARIPVRPTGIRVPEPGRRSAWRDRPYVAVAGLSAVLCLYMPMLSVVLPLFVVQRTSAPGPVVAAAFAVNTIGVIALQLRAGRRVDGMPAAARSVRAGGALLAASCAVFALAAVPAVPATAALVVLAGAAVQVVGEVLFAAGNWELGFGLADPRRPGAWQGVYGTGIPVARAVGPLLLSFLVVDWRGPGWLVVAALLLAAALAVPPTAGWAARTRPVTARPLVASPAH